ncbi:MAG: HAMP domain-containing protein [Dissulfurispiraceae bacterium]
MRKLRGANVSIHKLPIADDRTEINENLFRAKTRLEDCRLNLKTMLAGGLIKDYSRSSDELYDEYMVFPVKAPQKRTEIEHAIASISELERTLTEFTTSMETSRKMTDELKGQLSQYDALTQSTVADLNKLSVALSTEWGTVSDLIKAKFKTGLLLISITFIIGASLSIIFGFLISRNIVEPVIAIISRFKAFSSREHGIAGDIPVTSKDEIGELAGEYNRLMDTIKVVTSFKSVIEEDESVEDIYLRLGNIMTSKLGFNKCEIYEISTYSNTIKPVYPPGAEVSELRCGADILLNSDLCRVKRTGHVVSSMEYEGI